MTVKEVQAVDTDIEKTFVYRGLRLGIVKPYFPSGSGVTYEPVRNVGIIDEDGVWVYFLSQVDQDLKTAEWQARHYVVDSMLDDGVMDGMFDQPDPKLYQRLGGLTNSSHDKRVFEKVEDAVRQVKMILDDAWSSANSIKYRELKCKALDAVLAIERWFD